MERVGKKVRKEKESKIDYDKYIGLLEENNQLLFENNQLLREKNEDYYDDPEPSENLLIDGFITKAETVSVKTKPHLEIEFFHGQDVKTISFPFFDLYIISDKYSYLYEDVVADVFENIGSDFYKVDVIKIIKIKLFLAFSALLNEFDYNIMDSVMHDNYPGGEYEEMLVSASYINMRYDYEIDDLGDKIIAKHYNKHNDHESIYEGARAEEFRDLMMYWEKLKNEKIHIYDEYA